MVLWSVGSFRGSALGGNGGYGTSYSGGGAGGWVFTSGGSGDVRGGNAGNNGGGMASYWMSPNDVLQQTPSGNIGLPGGLLIVFTNILAGNGTFSATGGRNVWYNIYEKWECNGSSSGGGSINIMYQLGNDISKFKSDVSGGKTYAGKHYGGNGTINFNSIAGLNKFN